MFVADPPAASAPAPAANQPDVVEVVGTRRDQALKIDRRTYQVQQTPHSAQKDAVQLLRGLPAVTIAPDDSVALLGNSNVRIFVDGRPYLGDPAQYLRTLHGGDIERIEIITNPSAQYSAEGTGGVINFVLRKKQGNGTSGTFSTEIFTPGDIRSDASVKVKIGKWTLELGGAADTGRTHSSYRKIRSVEDTLGGPETTDDEKGIGRTHEISGYGSGKITYDVDSKTSISANFVDVGFRQTSRNSVHFDAVTPDFDPFDEHQIYFSSGSFRIGELAFDHKGSKEGETLTASLSASDNPQQKETDRAEFSSGGSLFTERLKGFKEHKAQIDWAHPMAKGEILSLGAAWDRSQMTEDYRFTSAGTGGLEDFTAADQFAGVDNQLVAYATFQQPIGSWTVMPGIRVERDSRQLSSDGHPTVHVNRTDVFPTLHIDHAFSKIVSLTLSYSKRIDRPQLNELRPYAIVQDVLNVKRGNPHLQNQSTDAFEANLHYHRGKIDAGLVVYDRETSRLWSTAYSVENGINVNMQINAGRSRDRGAEIDISTPIVAGFKVNGSVNLFDQRIPIDAITERNFDDQFRFTTDTTLEWDGKEHGDRPGDVAQLQWIYYSPSRQFDVHQFDSNWISLSYTHSFTHTASVTATLDYLAASRHRLDAALVQEDYSSRRPAEFKLKLLKTFGKH